MDGERGGSDTHGSRTAARLAIVHPSEEIAVHIADKVLTARIGLQVE
jgi:hypothetical protein